MHNSNWSMSSKRTRIPSVEYSSPWESISTGYWIRLVKWTGVSTPVTFSVSGSLKYQAKLKNNQVFIYSAVAIIIQLNGGYLSKYETFETLPWRWLHFAWLAVQRNHTSFRIISFIIVENSYYLWIWQNVACCTWVFNNT